MLAIHIIFSVALTGLAAAFSWDFYKKFKAETGGTFKERFIAAGHGSMVIAIQRVVAILASLATIVPMFLDVFVTSGVSQAVQGILPTGMVPYYMVILSVLTEMARRRTGGGGSL